LVTPIVVGAMIMHPVIRQSISALERQNK